MQNKIHPEFEKNLENRKSILKFRDQLLELLILPNKI